MTDDFRSLLERARRGDREARDALLGDHLPGLRAFVRVRSGAALRARERCSDLVQTVCREVLNDLDGADCEAPEEFRRWLYAVALHKIVRKAEYHAAQKRAVEREATPVDDGVLLDAYATVFTPSRAAVAREEVDRIERALDALPEEFRDVIVQARLLGMSHQEISAQTGRSEVAVRKLLSRARARLAIELEKD